MIYYIVLCLILVYIGLCKNINSSDKRKRSFLIFSFGLLTLIAMLRSSEVGRDLNSHYARNFTRIAHLTWRNLQAYSNSSGYEIGFIYFCKIISFVSDDPQWFIFVTSIINCSVLARFIYKHSEDVVFSTFLVIFSCYYYMSMNIIRQGLAISIILIAFEVLVSDMSNLRRYMIFALLTLLATTFHQSAIICLVFILFDILDFKRAHIIIALVVTIGMYYLYDRIYSFVLIFMGNSERYAAHITSATEGVGGFSLNALFNIVLTFGAFIYGYISLVASKKQIVSKKQIASKMQINKYEFNEYGVYKQNVELSKTKNLYMYLTLMAGVFRLLVVRMNILNRVTFYFLPFVFIMYPLAVENGGKCHKLIKQCIYIAYFAYFTYMTVNLAQEYYGTIPYIFFWQ